MSDSFEKAYVPAARGRGGVEQDSFESRQPRMHDSPRPMELAREGYGAPGAPGDRRGRDASAAAAAIARQLRDALPTAMALLGADAGAVFARRPGVGLVLVADAGLSADELVRLRASPVRPELALPPSGARAADQGVGPTAAVTRGGGQPDRAGGFPTVCTLPIAANGGERWGILELYFRRSRRLAPSRRELAETFVRQLGWALERDRRASAAEGSADGPAGAAAEARPESRAAVARELGLQQRAAERAVRLQTVTGALARANSLPEVCAVIVRQCADAAGAASASCHLVSGGALAPAAASSHDPAAHDARPLELAERALDSGALVCDGDAEGFTLMALPLVAADEVQGVLVLDYASPVRPERGGREYLTAIARVAAQALERVRLHAAARAASQAKSDFLAMMSHELRTPLNAIMGYTGLMADEVVGPLNRTQRDQLHRVQEHARHLLTLIEEILTLSRAEAGRDDLRTERVDPAALLREVAEVLAPSAARKGLVFDVRVAGAPHRVRTDADKVRQVLAHLLTNAIKFTAEGSVTARVTQVEVDGDEMIEYAVRDTGVGIASEHLTSIFEPFWQADQARTRRFPGTGLGLNVTRRLADLLGGEVSVTSAPGKGSEFVFRMPVKE